MSNESDSAAAETSTGHTAAQHCAKQIHLEIKIVFLDNFKLNLIIHLPPLVARANSTNSSSSAHETLKSSLEFNFVINLFRSDTIFRNKNIFSFHTLTAKNRGSGS